MPPISVHFNGSVNLPDADTVFRELATRVPGAARRLPDGETGQRRAWIGFQLPRLLETPGLERVEPTGATGYAAGRPSTRLSADVDPQAIPWPDLGYASAYQESYGIFRRLVEDGVIPRGTRFQVEYPTPRAVMSFVDPTDRPVVEPSYEQALLADLDVLLDAVPHDDIAVQWDVAHEIRGLESGDTTVDEVSAGMARLIEPLPHDVPIGIHLCYGDFGHQHFFQPRSLATQIDLANALTDVAGRMRRHLAWVSFTVPQDRADREYLEPLTELDSHPDTELYLALVPYHPQRQEPGTTKRQIQLVDEYLAGRPWGICTECGLGRVDPDEVLDLLDHHHDILQRHT